MIITSVTRMASFRHLLAAMARAQEWADAAGEPILVVRYMEGVDFPHYYAALRPFSTKSEIVARAFPRPPHPPRPREPVR